MVPRVFNLCDVVKIHCVITLISTVNFLKGLRKGHVGGVITLGRVHQEVKCVTMHSNPSHKSDNVKVFLKGLSPHVNHFFILCEAFQVFPTAAEDIMSYELTCQIPRYTNGYISVITRDNFI
jgi:hypothetical protein